MLFKLFSTVFIGLIALCLASFGYAKTVNLYDQPKTDAKVVDTIDVATTGIVPIFSPKPGDWIKVADPRNGNVGWIKSTDLQNAGQVSNSFSFTQESTGNGHGVQSYVVRFGTPEQSQNIAKQFQAQQQIIQKSMQQMIQDISNSLGQAWVNFPVIMPVVVIPQPVKSPTAATATTTSTTTKQKQ